MPLRGLAWFIETVPQNIVDFFSHISNSNPSEPHYLGYLYATKGLISWRFLHGH